MKKSHLILIVILVLAALGGYYAYIQYNTSKTQELIKTSHEIKINATTYFDQAEDYEKNGDYENAISMYQKSDKEVKKALSIDNNALAYAGGVYHEYLDKDVQLLEKTSQLIEYKIYLNQYHNNSLNPGQEKVPPSMLNPYIDKFTADVASLKAEKNQIIKNNPDSFTFLST